MADKLYNAVDKEHPHVKCLQSFIGSEGYVTHWKHRYNLISLKLSGEAASIPGEKAREGQVALQEVLRSFDLCDIFNLDELALFYRMMPIDTVGKRGDKGIKKAKDRVTVILITNADGSQKRKPIVIGKAPLI